MAWVFAIFIEELRTDAHRTLFKLLRSVDTEAAKEYRAVMQQLFLNKGPTTPGPIHQIDVSQHWLDDQR